MRTIWNIYSTIGEAYLYLMIQLGGTNSDGELNIWGALLLYVFQIVTTIILFILIMGTVAFMFFFVLDTFLFEGGETSGMWYQLKCHTFVRCY